MKYAILQPADQTITYFINDEGNETIDHKEAKLWDTREEAELIVSKHQNELIKIVSEATDDSFYFGKEEHFKDWFHIEEVLDELEFRSRKDTW